MCNFLTFWRSLTHQTRQNTHFFNILARQKNLIMIIYTSTIFCLENNSATFPFLLHFV